MTRTGVYYGWVLVGVLALTVTVSYGVLMYAFPVVLAPMQLESGWSQLVLTGGFSAAALTAGVAAIPVGRAVDRYGPRVIMTAGSALATVLLLAWSRVTHPVAYWLVWMGLGVCMAGVFYEPAFTVVARWFREERARALAIITIAGGLASVIFVPLTSWLVATIGWRDAVVWLAIAFGVLTILPHALLLRRHPVDSGSEHPREHAVPARIAFRSVAFRWVVCAFFLSSVANFAVAVHLVPLLLLRGYPLSFAAGSLALLGLAKLPGRMLLEPVVRRSSTPAATVLVFGVQAAGLLAMLMVPGAAGVWIFAALFGAGDGASTPARGAIVAEFFGSLEYGYIGGMLAFFIAAGRAAAPVGGSMLYGASGSYDLVLWVLTGIVTAAAFAMRRADPASIPRRSRLPIRQGT